VASSEEKKREKKIGWKFLPLPLDKPFNTGNFKIKKMLIYL
jgi:hypothetical protein